MEFSHRFNLGVGCALGSAGGILARYQTAPPREEREEGSEGG